MNFKCTKCQTKKFAVDFGKSSKFKDGRSRHCISCVREYHADYRNKNREKVRALSAKGALRYYYRNLEKYAAYRKTRLKEHREATKKYRLKYPERVAARREKNREKMRAYLKQHYVRNKAKYLAKWWTRKANKINATPKWLTPEQKQQIIDIYRNCPPGHHVDHIIPLNNPKVSGLHVPWNLQYLTAEENLRKGNKF